MTERLKDKHLYIETLSYFQSFKDLCRFLSFPKGIKTARTAKLFFKMLGQGTPTKSSVLRLRPVLAAHQST